jgi:hypothetical protein
MLDARAVRMGVLTVVLAVLAWQLVPFVLVIFLPAIAALLRGIGHGPVVVSDTE